MLLPNVTEHTQNIGKHRCFYLASGPEDGPLIIFVHGWPELGYSWRHQLTAMAALGFRCIAPDMRGYGASTVYKDKEDYSLENSVGDMLGLLDHLKRRQAIWIGHDWGSPVVWNLASHHPERCRAVASLCVPYSGPTLSAFDYIDRDIYPEDKYPAGQWEYMLYYYENFDRVTAEFDSNVRAALIALFRKGDPAGVGKPAATALVRKAGGFFRKPGDAADSGSGPDTPALQKLDTDIISEADLAVYCAALERNGFFGPSAWYVNMASNASYATTSLQDGRLEMPVLFVGAMYDYTCETIHSKAKEPMLQLCRQLTLAVVKSGHWMAQEKPIEVNGLLAKWLATEVSDIWPEPH